MTTISVSAGAPPRDSLELTSLVGLLAFAASLQISIAAANIFLTVTLACWAISLAIHRERVEVPAMFWPLFAYAGATLVSAAFSPNPRASFVDSKQLVLFLLVPAVYQLARGARAMTVVHVIVTVGAVSAAFGIIQYGVFEYDNLGRRPEGALTHYMTYSGLLMLVICAAAARILFETRDRGWPAVVMPALLVAVVLTFTRSAWVGACVAIGLLLTLKDFRLLAALPVIAALFFAIAPARLTDRLYSMFDLQDPTNRDRVAMLKEGVQMVRAHPLAGVGPNMVQRLYAEYRDPGAGERVNPHLHNVPVQIAAERGLPALAIWIWFVGTIVVDLYGRFRRSRHRFLAASGLAAVAAMLSAGMFEYNFGDSEFLMLFLVLVTLPYAADRNAGLP